MYIRHAGITTGVSVGEEVAGSSGRSGCGAAGGSFEWVSGEDSPSLSMMKDVCRERKTFFF